MLEIDGVGFSFGLGRRRKKVLDNVDICVGPGEAVCLTGPSGCGKTTLALISVGLLRPSEGRVAIGGEDVTRKKRDCRSMQIVLQNPYSAFNPAKTVQWSLKETCAAAGIPKEDWRSKAADAMSGMDLPPEFMHRYPDEMSGGELQRLSIARAVIMNPRYLVLDEVTTMLDLSTQAQIWHSLLEICEDKGTGMLVITHDKDLASFLGDRIVHMKDGRVERTSVCERDRKRW